MFTTRETKEQTKGLAPSSRKQTSPVRTDSTKQTGNLPGSTHFLQRNLGNSFMQSTTTQQNTLGLSPSVKDASLTQRECSKGTSKEIQANRTLALSGEVEQEQTISSASTSGNSFSITFDPSTSTPTPQGDRIQFIQSIQMTADGVAIKPGTYYSGFAYRDPTATSDATYIDHLSNFTTPYLADHGFGTAGHSNSSGTANATFSDAPGTGGGDKGFHSASNPTGWRTVTYNFETLAFCTEGTDCGTWYDGIGWSYTKTAADQAAGNNGVSTTTNSLAAPSSSTIAAFNKFNSVKSFTPCTMSVSPGP